MEKNQKSKSGVDATQCLKLAVPMMNQHGVDPTPNNYAIWFDYVSGKNRPLIDEIDQMIEEGRSFTVDSCNYLYHKYISADLDKKSVEEASAHAKTLLEHISRMIDLLSGETSAYSEDLDEFTKTITTQIKSDALKPLIHNIASKTRKIKERGTELNKKLESSNFEISRLKKSLAQVKVESSKDFLTGVDNRKSFDSKINQLISSCKASGEDLCLLMLDIDHFKKYNDKWGHQLGDEVLRLVSQAAQNTLRGSDFIARYGGEEFAVLLPATPLSGALLVAEKLKHTVATRVLRRKDTGEICGSVTVSIGVSLLRHKTDTAETLVKRADEALYKSKIGGRNKVTTESN